MIIDVHAHTTNHKLWELHTETATISDLELIGKKCNVAKTIVMATYFPFKGTGLHNRDLLGRIKSREQFSMLASLNVMDEFVRGVEELEEMLQHDQVVGIKLYPGYQDFSPSDKKMFVIYELVQKYNVPVMLHCGELHHCCPENVRSSGMSLRCGMNTCPIDQLGYLSHPEQVLSAAKRFPDVRFVLSHLGNPYFAECRYVMKECSNVYTDISGQFKSGSKKATEQHKQMICNEIAKFLTVPYGIDRIMFGTDFPIQSYEDSIFLIEDLGLVKYDRDKIFYQNAKNIFKI